MTQSHKPHLNPGTIGGQSRALTTLSTSLGSLGAMACSPQPGETSFSMLSQEAQDLIVSAMMGEFDESGPPEIPENVKAEIAGWASEPDAENAHVDPPDTAAQDSASKSNSPAVSG